MTGKITRVAIRNDNTSQGSLIIEQGVYQSDIVAGSDYAPSTLQFDSSRSSAIYGKSSKVQPSAFQALIIIKA